MRDSLPSDDPAVMALLSVDSTSVRAHQHAAGARFSGPEVLTEGGSEWCRRWRPCRAERGQFRLLAAAGRVVFRR
ncbi:hypothetical protein ACIRSS_39150 [Amycolatopsis sp. NPDC101161]|uniref:hypothetical protein n=1 Tax=Amycolatopsis sp. NPDC101161 TaxID=3363940 RepID=UPI00381EFF32